MTLKIDRQAYMKISPLSDTDKAIPEVAKPNNAGKKVLIATGVTVGIIGIFIYLTEQKVEEEF